MDKEIKRIRINRLYSENNVFDEILFHDGINLILGEIYDNTTVNEENGKTVFKDFFRQEQMHKVFEMFKTCVHINPPLVTLS